MANIDLSTVHQQLGELRGDVKAILRSMEQERQDARDARARVYERVERVEKSVAIAGQVAAQARDKADIVEKTILEDVKPQTDRLKNLGVKGSGVLAGAALVGGLTPPVYAAVADALGKIFKP